MIQIVTLLAGIILAGVLFASLIWSLAQIFRTSGRQRVAHGLAIVSAIAAMAALSWPSPAAALPPALLLAAAGIYLAVAERGWNRLLPLAQAGFGIAIASGLPFGG